MADDRGARFAELQKVLARGSRSPRGKPPVDDDAITLKMEPEGLMGAAPAKPPASRTDQPPAAPHVRPAQVQSRQTMSGRPPAAAPLAPRPVHAQPRAPIVERPHAAAPAVCKFSIRLVRLGPEGKPSEEFNFENEPVIKIGKLPDSHVLIDDISVSRMHAVIELSDTGCQIVDLGATRHTFVNGERITKRILNVGDRIRLGDAELKVEKIEFGAAASEPAHAPPPVELPPQGAPLQSAIAPARAPVVPAPPAGPSFGHPPPVGAPHTHAPAAPPAQARASSVKPPAAPVQSQPPAQTQPTSATHADWPKRKIAALFTGALAVGFAICVAGVTIRNRLIRNDEAAERNARIDKIAAQVRKCGTFGESLPEGCLSDAQIREFRKDAVHYERLGDCAAAGLIYLELGDWNSARETMIKDLKADCKGR